jgi:type I restriction enzyme, S subunit
MKKGWKIKKLGEIAKINYGYTEKASFNDIGPKFLRITDIKDDGVEWISVPYCKCSDMDLPKYQLKEADIVFARTGATTGKSYLVKNPPNAVFASYLIRLKLISKKDFSPEFVSYYFQTKYYWDKINAGISGSAQGGFNATKLGQLYFPIPPLPEQQRIVSILNKAFAAIAKAKTNAEQNLKSAKELFESYLQGVFENGGEDWEEKALSNIGIVQTGTTPPTKDKSNYGDYIPFAKPPHFRPNGSIDTGESMLSKKGLEKGRLFATNSVLMVCIGATIGKTGFSEKPITSNQQINALTPSNNYLPKLLYYALISPFVQKQVLEQGRSAQATLPIINKTKWKKLLVNIPKDKTKQSEIIEVLDKLKIHSQKLEANYQQKIVDLEKLKKSVLQKAFNGEL